MSVPWSPCGGAVACRHGLAVLHRHTAFRKEFQRLGIELVLDGEHARGKCLGVVAGKHRHGCLTDNRAFVHALGDEMYRAAGDPHAGVYGALVGVEARKERQQRRMDIDDPAFVALDEGSGQQPHIAGKADDIRRKRVQGIENRRLVRFLAGIGFAHKGEGRNALGRRLFETARIRPVGDDADDFGWIVFRLRGLHQRHHVGAAAGNEDDDAFARRTHIASVPL